MKKLRTFVADDSLFVRKRFIEILSRINNVEIVGQAENGNEALKSIIELRPDVALLDINMPDMSGIEILPIIKAYKPDIKVILFTGYSVPDMKEECLNRGADFFFQSNCIDSIIDLLGSMREIINDK